MDNSTDDHAQIGDTHCTVTCHTDSDTNDVEFVRECDGAQVESGNFTDGSTTCGDLQVQAEANGDSFQESEQPVFDLQAGSL